MDLVRGFVGFVFGAIVVAGLHFSGMLDGPSHWWSRHTGIGTGTVASEDDGRARYTIHAISQDGGDCQPQYEFHNLTNRNVTFATNWDDQPSAAPPSTQSGTHGAPISLQPSHSGLPSNGPQQGNAPQGYDSQNDDQQDADDQDDGRRRNGGDDQYDDQYPGGGGASACNAGVIQIFVDRKK